MYSKLKLLAAYPETSQVSCLCFVFIFLLASEQSSTPAWKYAYDILALANTTPANKPEKQNYTHSPLDTQNHPP